MYWLEGELRDWMRHAGNSLADVILPSCCWIDETKWNFAITAPPPSTTCIQHHDTHFLMDKLVCATNQSINQFLEKKYVNVLVARFRANRIDERFGTFPLPQNLHGACCGWRFRKQRRTR
jgi:hypothetical protein